MLKDLSENIKENWDVFINNWKNEGKIIPNHFEMKKMFNSVANFLKEADDYNSVNRIPSVFKPAYDPPTLVETIKTVLKLYKITNNISEIVGLIPSFQEAMKYFIDEFS